MTTVSISLKTLFNSGEVCDDIKVLNFAEIVKTEDGDREWFDLYNKDGALACMDGEEVEYTINNNGDYEFTNKEGESSFTFILTTKEFNEAVYQ